MHDDLASRFAQTFPDWRSRKWQDFVFYDLITRHGEAHRRYHGLDHLRALFALLDQHAAQCSDRAFLDCAVWWHDAIYDPTRQDNEDQSASLMLEHFSAMAFAPPWKDMLAAMIRATRNHWTAPSFGEGDLFMDADIAILGAPTDIYDRYARHVREEYAHVPDDLFRAGRGHFLNTAAGFPRLFKTDAFEAAYASQARANMQRDAERLSMAQ